MNLEYWKQNSPRIGIWARSIQQNLYRLLHGRSSQKRIAMFHAGRCGSSVLADMIGQHSDVHWASEVFENMLPCFYNMSDQNRAKARITASIHPPTKAFYGFETKYLPEQHFRKELANHSPQSYIKLLKQLGFEYYILLYRENHLRRAVSTAIGAKTNQWSSVDRRQQKTTVRLDPEKFVSYGETITLKKFFESIEMRHREVKQAIGDMPLLELSYENDVYADPTIGYKRICDFIGTEAIPSTQVRLQKQNPTAISDLVENYEELSSYLSGTRYEWMLTAN